VPKKAGEKMAGSNFIVRGGGDFSQISRGLKDTQSQLKNFKGEAEKASHGISQTLGGVVDGLGLSFIKLGKVAMAAAVTTGIVELGKKAIGVASDLTEVQNVVDVTFGNMSKDIDDFAANALDKFGLSQLSAKEFSSTMGATLKASGITGNSMKEMSKSLTGLAADMASFYNLDPEVAFSKLRSGITGETEPLKQLGINMNIANLEAWNLSQGINKSWQEMSLAEQTMARYNYIMAVTGDAQGDFARNTGTWANQTRILKERWTELMGIIGQGLVKVLLPLVKFLNKILDGLIKIAQAVGKVFSMITGKQIVDKSDVKTQQSAVDTGIDLSKINTGIGKSADKAGKGQSKLGKGIDKARAAAQKALAPFDEINRLQKEMGDNTGGGGLTPGINTGGGGGGIGGLGTMDVGPSISDGLDDAKKKSKDFFPWFAAKWNGFKELVTEPVFVKAPVFESLPSPIWVPNWGLDVPPIPLPYIPPLPFPVFNPTWNLTPPLVPLPVFPGLPAPVYQPKWNLFPPPVPAVNLGLYIASLLDMQAQTSKTMDTVGADVKDGLGVTEKNLATNKDAVGRLASATGKVLALGFAQGLVSANKDVRNFIPGYTGNLVTMGLAVSSIAFQAAKGWAGNLFSGLKSSLADIRDWGGKALRGLGSFATSSLNTFAQWGTNLARSIGSALSIAWANIKNFASAAGEKLSGWYSENKGTVRKVGIVVGAGVGIAAAVHFAPAAVPFIAKAAQAAYNFVPAGAYANGGYPTPGQLFIANEPGNPEMIGNIGGKTAVANNDQIVEAISQGVYEAVSSVGGNIDLTVNVGGETLLKKVIEGINRQNRISGTNVINV